MKSVDKGAKACIRREIKSVISHLDERWERDSSRRIANHLERVLSAPKFAPIQHVLAWVKAFPGEVDLSPFITSLLSSFRVYLPITSMDGLMSFVKINSDWAEALALGELGVPEPLDRESARYDLSNAQRTIVFVPGLAFDKKGNRIGRGRGCYDRFLMSVSQWSLKIGVCWSLQIKNEIPTDPLDIKMDLICTEEGILSCGSDWDCN